MPLDPSIPLSVNQPKPPDMIGQAMQAYTLKSAMMQSQQAEQSMQAQQLLSSVISDPNAHQEDPAVPGLQTLKPEAWAALQKNPIAFQKAKEAERQMLQDYSMKSQLKQKQTEEFYKRAGPIALSLVAEQEKGKLDDASMQPKIDEAVAGLKASGLQVPPGVTMAQVKQLAAQMPEYQKRLLGPTPAEQERAKPPIVRELEAAGIKQGTPEFKKAMDKRIARETAPTKTQINLAGGVPGAGGGVFANVPPGEATQDPVKVLGNYGYSPDGAAMAAYNRLFNNQYPKGMGKTVQPRNAAIDNYAAKMAKELGIDMQTAATMPAEFKANASSLIKQTTKLDMIQAQLTSFHNNVETWDSIAQGVAPKLGGEKAAAMQDQLSKIHFFGIKSVDDVKLRIQEQVNDPTVAAYLTATMAVAMDLARIQQGPQSAASLTESARKDAQRLLAPGLNDAARKATIGTLYSDTEGQVKGLETQIQRTKARMHGKFGGGGEGDEKPTQPDKSVPGSTGKKWVFDPASGTLKPQ